MLQSSSRLAGRLCDVAQPSRLVTFRGPWMLPCLYGRLWQCRWCSTYVLHYPSAHVVCVVACIVVVGHSVPAHQILFRPVTRILCYHCQKCGAKPPQNYRMIIDIHRVRKNESTLFLCITLPRLDICANRLPVFIISFLPSQHFCNSRLPSNTPLPRPTSRHEQKSLNHL